MKSSKIIIAVLVLSTSQALFAQQTGSNWEKWNHLMGEWVGEGNGQPGQGEGKFSFENDLDGKILVRKNHTIFPATANSKVTVHDDLLIVYKSAPGAPDEAIYFDNEGNTIKYKVVVTEKAIVLTSDIIPNLSRFRLSYVTIDSSTVNVTFEMASPQSPEAFKMYLSGKALKVK